MLLSAALPQNGQLVVVRAERPSELPNAALLELRWQLTRMFAMCGASSQGPEGPVGDVDGHD